MLIYRSKLDLVLTTSGFKAKPVYSFSTLFNENTKSLKKTEIYFKTKPIVFVY